MFFQMKKKKRSQFSFSPSPGRYWQLQARVCLSHKQVGSLRAATTGSSQRPASPQAGCPEHRAAQDFLYRQHLMPPGGDAE